MCSENEEVNEKLTMKIWMEKKRRREKNCMSENVTQKSITNNIENDKKKKTYDLSLRISLT